MLVLVGVAAHSTHGIATSPAIHARMVAAGPVVALLPTGEDAVIVASGLPSGVYALLGTLAGGVLTFGAQWVADKRKRDREAELADQKVRGIARVAHHYLTTWERILDRSAEAKPGFWWEPAAEPPQRWDLGDLQTLASALPVDTWATVREALLMTGILSVSRLEAKDKKQSFDEVMRTDGMHYKGLLKAGSKQLERGPWA